MDGQSADAGHDDDYDDGGGGGYACCVVAVDGGGCDCDRPDSGRELAEIATADFD